MIELLELIMLLPVNHFIVPTVPALNYWNKKPVFSRQKVGKPFPGVKTQFNYRPN